MPWSTCLTTTPCASAWARTLADWAQLNFEHEGIAVTPYPADFWVSGNPQLYLIKFAPNASALLTNTVFLQEKLRIFVTRYLE